MAIIEIVAIDGLGVGGRSGDDGLKENSGAALFFVCGLVRYFAYIDIIMPINGCYLEIQLNSWYATEAFLMASSTAALLASRPAPASIIKEIISKINYAFHLSLSSCGVGIMSSIRQASAVITETPVATPSIRHIIKYELLCCRSRLRLQRARITLGFEAGETVFMRREPKLAQPALDPTRMSKHNVLPHKGAWQVIINSKYQRLEMESRHQGSQHTIFAAW